MASLIPMVIGGWEWVIIIIAIVILLFGGAAKIPEFARALGRAVGEFKKGRVQVEEEIEELKKEKKKLEEKPAEEKRAKK